MSTNEMHKCSFIKHCRFVRECLSEYKMTVPITKRDGLLLSSNKITNSVNSYIPLGSYLS